MQLNPAAFDSFLQRIGEDFLWRVSNTCACINPVSGAPNPNCPVCGGKGHLWAAPVQAVAGVASSQTQLQWQKFGAYESGDTVLSIPQISPMYEIGQFDRITALTSSDGFSLPLVRGAPSERLHKTVQRVDRVFWLSGSAVVEGNTKVVVSEAGQLSWPEGGAPPAGVTYSITGSALNEFFCFGQFSSDRMKHHGARLPRRMVLRRFDLLNR